MVSVIIGALAMSIVFSAVCIQDVIAVNRFTSARHIGLAVRRAPDETFRLFETYEAEIDTKEIQQRLHWMAVFLKENPDFNGFIVSYAGQRACSGEAIKRAKIARQFLIRNEGVKSKQLRIVDAGYRNNWAIELWFGPMRAKGQPSSRSAINRSVITITKRCSNMISLP